LHVEDEMRLALAKC